MNPPVDPNDDLRALRELPAGEPPRDFTDRVRRRAHAQMEDASWVGVATRAWSRVLVPAALAVTVVVYLSWAVQTASALYR